MLIPLLYIWTNSCKSVRKMQTYRLVGKDLERQLIKKVFIYDKKWSLLLVIWKMQDFLNAISFSSHLNEKFTLV